MAEGRDKVKPEPRALLDVAARAAERASAFLAEQEGTIGPEGWSEKGRADYVTEVDREAERLAAEVLQAAEPDGKVIGEELSPEEELPPGLAWIVDPLDGTTNFLHRFPYFAVSVAAAWDGEVVAGVVHHVPPALVYRAVRGEGAWVGERGLRVSRVADPRHALIGTGFPFKYRDRLPEYQAQFAAVLAGSAGVRRPGSAALDLCDVAAGRFDGFWELQLAPWDVAAGTLIVREAGGVVTGLAGEPDVLRHGPIVAGNPPVHAWLLQTLNAKER